MPEKSLISLASAALLFVAAVCDAGPVAAIELPRTDGKLVRPFETNATAIAFVFVSTECPIANRYSPEVQRLQKKFESIAFWLVYPNNGETDQGVSKHLAEFRHTAPALRDPDHKLTRLAQARVTPEAAVFTRTGELLYHGRIDDRNVDFGKERAQPIARDLEAALTAVIQGEKPKAAGGRAVGCPIR